MAAGLLPMAAPVCPVICGFSTPYPRHSGAQVRHSGARVKGAASPPSCLAMTNETDCLSALMPATNLSTVMPATSLSTVMPALVAGIHVLRLCNTKDVDGNRKSGLPENSGTSPAMTKEGFCAGHDVETHCLSAVMPATNLSTVMPGLVPGIHVFLRAEASVVLK